MKDGDGNAGYSQPASGMTRYVTFEQFKQYAELNDEEHDKVSLALWGAEGRNGLIGDVRDIKLWIKILGFVGGIAITIIAPLVTTFLLQYFGVVG